MEWHAAADDDELYLIYVISLLIVYLLRDITLFIPSKAYGRRTRVRSEILDRFEDSKHKIF